MSAIQEAQRRQEGALMRLPNVVAVGIGDKDGRPVIKVFVVRKVAPSELTHDQTVPQEVEGYETDVEEIGEVKTHS